MHVDENYWFNWILTGVCAMLRVFELNVKDPAFAKHKIAQMRRVFFKELSLLWPKCHLYVVQNHTAK